MMIQMPASRHLEQKSKQYKYFIHKENPPLTRSLQRDLIFLSAVLEIDFKPPPNRESGFDGNRVIPHHERRLPRSSPWIAVRVEFDLVFGRPIGRHPLLFVGEQRLNLIIVFPKELFCLLTKLSKFGAQL